MMNAQPDEFGYRAVAEIQFRTLSRDIDELKERLRGLETLLARGVMLLVANLVGVALSLAQTLLN